MTAPAEASLDKAWQALKEARAEAGIDLAEAAGRAAYLAAFHAAQALIVARTGRVAKTHRGVHAQFSRMASEEPRLAGLQSFLSQSYNFKVVADYDVGPTAVVSLERARAAIDAAQSFVDRVAALLP